MKVDSGEPGLAEPYDVHSVVQREVMVDAEGDAVVRVSRLGSVIALQWTMCQFVADVPFWFSP